MYIIRKENIFNYSLNNKIYLNLRQIILYISLPVPLLNIFILLANSRIFEMFESPAICGKAAVILINLSNFNNDEISLSKYSFLKTYFN